MFGLDSLKAVIGEVEFTREDKLAAQETVKKLMILYTIIEDIGIHKIWLLDNFIMDVNDPDIEEFMRLVLQRRTSEEIDDIAILKGRMSERTGERLFRLLVVWIGARLIDTAGDPEVLREYLLAAHEPWRELVPQTFVFRGEAKKYLALRNSGALSSKEVEDLISGIVDETETEKKASQ